MLYSNPFLVLTSFSKLHTLFTPILSNMMNPFSKLSECKPKPLATIASYLDSNENAYPLGVLHPQFNKPSLLKYFRATVSISTAQKNADGQSGLLILGWGGMGKTVLINTIAHTALTAGHKVINYSPFDIEVKQGPQGMTNFTNANEFNAALTELHDSDLSTPAVVIIDAVEAYLTLGWDRGEVSTWSIADLLAMKTKLEKKFSDKILFIFTLGDLEQLEMLSLLRSNVALTVTGKIGAHHDIGKLYNGSTSHIFYFIASLKPGEFVIVEQEHTEKKGYYPPFFKALHLHKATY